MPIDSNVYVENLKTVLAQFEFALPEEKVNSEKARLDRLKKTLSSGDVEVNEMVAISGYTTYAHGLTMFQNKNK